ncbi:MspA family porin [Tsukamurella sp. NPDC003166]|uniref:MspA family porin n=1 Tax=Tsukamurella sp. NPDC003166 TaxID=3154444 RepID=UPI0033B95D0E
MRTLRAQRNRILGVISAFAAVAAISTPIAGAQVTPQTPSGTVRGGFQNITTKQGAKIKLSLYGLNARLIPSQAVTPLATQAVVGGDAEFHVDSLGSAKEISAISVKTGYMVGCQVHFDQFSTAIGTNQKGSVQFPNYVGAGAGAGVGGAGGLGGPIPAGALGAAGGVAGGGVTGIIPGVELGASQEQTFKLSPGTVQAAIMGEKTVPNPKTGSSGGIRYSNIKIGAEKCAGVVDAIPYVTTVISTATFDEITTTYGEIVRLA